MKGSLSIIGYVLFAIGFLAIVLSLVGINFSFLGWLEQMGRLPAFLIKLGALIIGLIIMYVSRIQPEEYELEEQ